MNDESRDREGVPHREKPEIENPETPDRPEMPEPGGPGPEMPPRKAPGPEVPSPKPPKGPEMPPPPPPEQPTRPEPLPRPEPSGVPPSPGAPEIPPTPQGPEVPPRERSFLAERPEPPLDVPRDRLAAQSRRDFLLLGLGFAASLVSAWWLLPDRAKGRLVGIERRDQLDTLASRVGLSRANREKTLNRALTFDDDVAEALYSKDRRVRTYRKSEVTPLKNNYHGRTPGPEHVAGWNLFVSGIQGGRKEFFTLERLLALPFHEQVTRLVCVEGWSAIAWWGGIRFADLLDQFPPAAGARWAALRSEISLDGAGRIEPYYVSLDLETARHPQTLLATHMNGAPLPLAHGAPLRLLAPVKLGLKNIKAITDIAFTAEEPPDYWNERGYSKYDGL
ncbi:MAG TPA: molybdopterin-dependent oxidoreductase, partial [Candidatus Eisenbacteria bacterium]|nr:molybdopterin-dependent oxidoreductase [Candidatus Eisenbacteria bacterium]